jgi:hypothetical protein
MTGGIPDGLDRRDWRQKMVFHPRQAHHAEQYERSQQRY